MLPFFAVVARAFISVAENAFIALYGKLNIASKVITGFSLPRYATLFSNGLNMLISLRVASV